MDRFDWSYFGSPQRDISFYPEGISMPEVTGEGKSSAGIYLFSFEEPYYLPIVKRR